MTVTSHTQLHVTAVHWTLEGRRKQRQFVGGAGVRIDKTELNTRNCIERKAHDRQR